MSKQIFITGFLRSGTTLLEKILHNHPEICIASQPFPYLYYHLKKAFYKKERLADPGYYILGHLFLESTYTVDELTNFLNLYEITPKEVLKIFKKMDGYSGQMTTGLGKYIQEITAGNLFHVYSQLSEYIKKKYNKITIYAGSKEVFCEEFVPFFLKNTTKVILIIRDPRDIITSLNFGRGTEFSGQPMPTLYSLRKWRKSVAFSLAHTNHPDFLFIRYEDLVDNPWPVLLQICDFLNIEPFSGKEFTQGIIDQDGNTWKGNSSFDEYRFISSNSIGLYKKKLPYEMIQYIESLCYAEMKLLKYTISSLPEGFNEKAVMNFQEPYKIMKDIFPSNYSSDNINTTNEMERYNKLKKNIKNEEEKQHWFIFPSVYDLLKKAIKE